MTAYNNTDQSCSPLPVAPIASPIVEPESPSNLFPGTKEVPSTVFDALRALPPIDLYTEYGLNESELTLYPEPLGKKICIVNVDTRDWNPAVDHEADLDSARWGWLNHYLYGKLLTALRTFLVGHLSYHLASLTSTPAQLHGYDFKHVVVPSQEPDGMHNTWVKVKEQFRMTMREEYQFVMVIDADIIFPDLRLPLEVLFSYWNITEDIALAGGMDLDNGLTNDRLGKIMLNTGLIITQKTPIFADMMRDWINCPTDTKYEGCSRWKDQWAHEQSAFSDYVRYDYADSIREIETTEVHSPEGKFIRHYWGPEKANLPEAAREAILGRFIPEILSSLGNTWHQHHELVRVPSMYDYLMKPGEWEDKLLKPHTKETSVETNAAADSKMI